MTLQTHMQVQVNRDGVVSRRTFLRSVAVGAAGMGLLPTLAAHAQELRRRQMSCILLYMNGGPSQFETFDPKPGHANGGPTLAINTATTGIRIADSWPLLAREMGSIALVRSMNNREGEHQRATYLMKTGYLPVGGVRFPSIGSIVASEIGPRDFDLPHFVQIGGRGLGGAINNGFLPMQFAPFGVGNPNQMPANTTLPGGTNRERFDRRLNLMQDLERDFAEAGGQARHRSSRPRQRRRQHGPQPTPGSLRSVPRNGRHPRSLWPWRRRWWAWRRRSGRRILVRPGLPFGAPARRSGRHLRRGRHGRLGHASRQLR